MLKWATLKWVTLRGLQGASWGFGLATCLGAFAAWVRLLPWMFAADVPASVIWPFARVLLASGLELALQVGLPTGWLIGWILAVERGEVRALLALGVRPAALAWRSVVTLGLISLCVVGGARMLSGPVEGAPAQVLSELVAGGQRYCDAHPDGVAQIPVAGLVEHCSSRRLLGRVPGPSSAWFAVSELRQDSLSEFSLGESEWLVQSADARWIHVEVDRVSVRGLTAPTSVARGWGRALGLVLSVACLGLLLGPLLRTTRATRSLLVCLAGCVVSVLVLKEVDRRALPSITYGLLLVPSSLSWIFAAISSTARPAQDSQ